LKKLIVELKRSFITTEILPLKTIVIRIITIRTILTKKVIVIPYQQNIRISNRYNW